MKTFSEYWPLFFFFGVATFCFWRAWRLHRRQKPLWKHSPWLCLNLREFNAPKRFNP